MGDIQSHTVIRKLYERQAGRYAEAAYYFVLDALDYTMFYLERNELVGEARHVSVQELLDGIVSFAKQEFGPLAPFVFNSWGITKTEDFGHLVFEMCDAGLLNRRESDRLQDFRDAVDLGKAFDEIGSIGFGSKGD